MKRENLPEPAQTYSRLKPGKGILKILAILRGCPGITWEQTRQIMGASAQFAETRAKMLRLGLIELKKRKYYEATPLGLKLLQAYGI